MDFIFLSFDKDTSKCRLQQVKWIQNLMTCYEVMYDSQLRVLSITSLAEWRLYTSAP